MEESLEEMNDDDCPVSYPVASEEMAEESNSLLLQFQCLGTSDREALIKDFQRLLAPMQLSVEGCTFFLEMNNWNLQQAICSYFDCDAPKDLFTPSSLPSMVLVKDVTIGEGEEIPPNTKFIKTWRIQNPGPDQWPIGCNLRFLSGAQLTSADRIIVDPLLPNQTGDISVEMYSPSQPGTYEGQWRMTTSNGMFFGEIIWVIITVAEGGLLGLTQQMSTFSSLGSPGSGASMAPPETNSVPRNPFGVSSSSFHGSSDHSSLLGNCLTMENNQVSINDSNEMEEMRNCQVSLNGSFDGSPLVIHNLNIDRLKSTPVDDNQENCFKICNDVLTRSPVAETRRSSIGRSFSLSHSPQPSVASQSQSNFDVQSQSQSNFDVQSQSQSNFDVHCALKQASLSPPSVAPSVASSSSNDPNPEASKGSASQFPPTPPAEDMMEGI